MRLLYVLLGLIQFSFAFHAVKSGRGCMWVTIIIVFPVVGCLAYYFLEVFPQSREDRALRRRLRDIAKAINPDGELKRRVEDLAQTGSIDNRVKLAGECLERGMFDDAIRLYEGCLEGPYANDASILFSCSRARLYNGDMRAAEEILARLARAHPRFRSDEVLLLTARAQEGLGDTQSALRSYETLRDNYVGFEAKYRYGVLLKRLGRADEARALFETICAHSRRSAVESERQWAKLAAAEREAAAT
jgi:hypothetical protein